MEIVESPIDYSTYSAAELTTLAKICCQRARNFEDSGQFSTAESVMMPFWNGVGTYPHTENLEKEIKAEILLRAGVLTGWLGNNNSVPHSQEWAKDLISEADAIFESLNLKEKSAEAQVELAGCYWREGSLDEARIILSITIEKIKFDENISNAVKGLAYLRRAVIENDEARFREAVYYLEQGGKIFDDDENPSLKGKYHNQMGIALQSIGDAEQNPDYLDRALIEYAAAGIYFEQVGHKRYNAFVENNTGIVYLSLKNFDDAFRHFENAAKIFSGLKEDIFVAQVEESIAKALIGRKLYAEAEQLARKTSVNFDKAERFALMIESLITTGIALSRLKKTEFARIEFERAEAVANRMNLPNLAGTAILTLLEELKNEIPNGEFVEYYKRADNYFGAKPEIESLHRMRKIASTIIKSETADSESLKSAALSDVKTLPEY